MDTHVSLIVNLRLCQSDHEIIPRLRNILSRNEAAFSDVEFDAQANTGKKILHQYVTFYFAGLAEHAALDEDTLTRWLEEEVDILMRSAAPGIFASCWMNLNPFIERLMSDSSRSPSIEAYENLF